MVLHDEFLALIYYFSRKIDNGIYHALEYTLSIPATLFSKYNLFLSHLANSNVLHLGKFYFSKSHNIFVNILLMRWLYFGFQYKSYHILCKLIHVCFDEGDLNPYIYKNNIVVLVLQESLCMLKILYHMISTIFSACSYLTKTSYHNLHYKIFVCYNVKAKIDFSNIRKFCFPYLNYNTIKFNCLQTDEITDNGISNLRFIII